MQQLRLFWAVNLPHSLKQKLFGIQSRLREVPADVKWVEQQNFHLTVKFLGDVNPSKTNEIIKSVREAVSGLGDFELEIAGLGFFPNSQRPKVIWAGVHGEVRKFQELYYRVEKSMDFIGHPSDSKRFSPHLTLGRLRSAQGSFELVQKAQVTEKETDVISKVKVDTIELMESQLTRKGPMYTVLETLKLAGGY